ncbi:MAG: monovalent cation/H+ antiporter subunit D family protein [Gemmatimonadetes bacterium]|nr:monovalent cation/H+ antiporter subunit D family protein [Gemmatimonadota bacterium]
MTGATLILLAVALPMLGALLVVLTGRRPDLRESMTLLTGLGLFAVVGVLASRMRDGVSLENTLIEVIPGLSLTFTIEPLGMLFALIASGLWIVTSAYSIGYMRAHHEENQTRFYAWFAVAIGAAIGVAFAGNLLTLFVFYEILTLSTYPLITHHGTVAARQAGRTYLWILLGTSIGFLLIAVIWTWRSTGTLDFRPGGILNGRVSHSMVPLLLALYAFGIGKAALMPFHRWLPAAMVAPTPVSALLHAVAVVKAGVFSVLKVVVYTFGIDFLHITGASVWLAYVAGVTIILASIIALTKDNLKARLAYSTISQLSYIVLGAALVNEAGVLGGGLHIATHAFGKITLFFCAGAIYVAAHKTEISQMSGIGRRMPFTMAAYTIGALSVIGLPPMGGTWSKWFLALGTIDARQYPLLAVLLISTLLSIAYLLPPAVMAFFARPDPAEEEAEHRVPVQEAPAFCLVPLCLTAIGCLVMFFFADDIYRFLSPIAGGSP